MISLIAAFMLATNSTPRELVMSCRSMIPADVELSGRIILRNRRGIVQAEHTYELFRTNAVTSLVVDGQQVAAPKPGQAGDSASTCLFNTDVTWSDLSLEYLWWDDFAFDGEREGESVHGQVCSVVVMKKAGREVRIWVDRKTGALMQAEEHRDGKPIRRLWGTRIKKFGERWVANVMEVETLGSGHRTKITVERVNNEN